MASKTVPVDSLELAGLITKDHITEESSSGGLVLPLPGGLHCEARRIF